jgi:thioredoxin reductase (NADPH)
MAETLRADIAIIGAGPTGLACAIEARRRGLSSVVIEKGSIVNTIRRYPTGMTFFSTPDLLTLGDIPFPTVGVRPTRAEALVYYRSVVRHFGLNLVLHSEVRGVEPTAEGMLLTSARGCEVKSRFVIVATGYFDNVNRLNVSGEDLSHVTHYYSEPYLYSGSDVVVVGGRNSAVETALDLWRNGANVTIIHRKSSLGDSVKYWVKPDIENRIKQGNIKAFFDTVVEEIREKSIDVRNIHTGRVSEIAADFVIAHTGYRPDEALLRSIGIVVDERTLVPEYDRETFESNIPGVYIAGSVACGCETWNIFIENGRAHALPILDDIQKNMC